MLMEAESNKFNLGKKPKFIKEKKVEFDSPTTAACYYDTNHIILGTNDGRILIVNIYDNRIVIMKKYHKSSVKCLIVTSNKKYIVSGSEDSSIVIWKYRNLDFVHELKEHKAYVEGLLRINDTHFASFSYDKNIIFWDLLKFQKKARFNSFHFCGIKPFILDKYRMITISYDNTFKVWKFMSCNNKVSLKQIHLSERLNSGLCSIGKLSQNSFIIGTYYGKLAYVFSSVDFRLIQSYEKEFDFSWIKPIKENFIVVIGYKDDKILRLIHIKDNSFQVVNQINLEASNVEYLEKLPSNKIVLGGNSYYQLIELSL